MHTARVKDFNFLPFFYFKKDLFILCIWVHCLQTHQKRVLDPIKDDSEPLCGSWELNSRPLEEQSVLLPAEPSLQPFVLFWFGSFCVLSVLRMDLGASCILQSCISSSPPLFLKIYLFIICKYTVPIFRHSKRGHQISLQMVVSHHAAAGNWTQDLWKSSQCS